MFDRKEIETLRGRVFALLPELQQRYRLEGFHIRGIFGSFARGDFDEFSDIDLAYELDRETFLKQNPGFHAASRLADIAVELRSAFGRKVDLFSLNSGNQNAVHHVSQELVNA